MAGVRHPAEDHVRPAADYAPAMGAFEIERAESLGRSAAGEGRGLNAVLDDGALGQAR